jgi:DNA polymerase
MSSDTLRRQVLEHLRYLHEIGLDALALPAVEPAGDVSTPAAPDGQAGEAKAGAMQEVRAALGDCSRCRLSESRTRIVFGAGSPQADLMFIGEAPGQEEDRRGEPFVGRAGQLLDKMIAAIGFSRQEVYIANIVKCRPPGNRNPREDEIQACGGFLTAQIEILAPRVIVALGKFAAATLLGEEIAITRARGRLRSYGTIPLMPTFHPAYLLRQYTRENRQAVYDDLLQVKALLDRAAST